MTDRIAKALTNLFDKHRIVFWYDSKRELRDEFEALKLEDVQKVEISNNEFGLKHLMLRREPDQKFLVYKYGPEPDRDVDNWLLDIQLSHGTFRTDQSSIWLSELGLGMSFADLVKNHEEFFRATKRIDALKRIMKPEDTPAALRMRMLFVCVAAEGTFDSVVENLLADLADERDDGLKLIQRCRLDSHLWQQIERHFGYKSQKPDLSDFAIELFKSCYAMANGENSRLSAEALIFFRRWKNNRHHETAFEKLSRVYSDILNVRSDVSQRDYRKLGDTDFFREIDREIIRQLVHAIATQTASWAEVQAIIKQRQASHWFDEFEHLYRAIGFAAEFLQAMTQVTLGMTSLAEGINRYSSTWYRIDQLYRKFVFHMQRSAQATLMAALFERVENLYVNNYLLKLNDAWQKHVDESSSWTCDGVPSQRQFFAKHVRPFRNKEYKICVIISDALRYEIADELLASVRALDRYDAELSPMLGSLPSYTQLGMASLLPNSSLAIADNDTGTVLLDGNSSQGLANRQKLLEAGARGDATAALKAEDFMDLKGDDARSLVREHDILYIYHNRIDATGDKLVSEERVFEAVDDTLEELIKLIKKLTGANANNIIVTADHGFIYQNRPLEESDFSSSDATGGQTLFRDRRFVIGRSFKDQAGFKRFSARELGLEGDVDLLFPKSINRLRLKGSGSRYVHGGVSLQEVVVPVVTINKKRHSDTAAVDVEIVGSSNQTITSGQHTVMLYQSTPVTDKIHPRRLRIGIYSQAGDLISDSHEMAFDFRSDNAREREVRIRLLLSKQADQYNGQEVILKLEEQHGTTSHYKEYRSSRYMLRRSFTSDFDF